MPVAGPDLEPPLRAYNPPGVKSPCFWSKIPSKGSTEAYRFNYYFDKYLFLPIVNSYEFVLPDYAEDRVSEFVDNICEFRNLYNNLLQLKFKSVGITLGRSPSTPRSGSSVLGSGQRLGDEAAAAGSGTDLRHYGGGARGLPRVAGAGAVQRPRRASA